MDLTDQLAVIYVSLLRSGLRPEEAENGLDAVADESIETFRQLLAEAGADDTGSRPAVSLRNSATSSVGNNANVDLLVAVQEVRDALSDRQLAAVLERFVSVALRDDRFEAEEARFISAVSRAWGIEAEVLESSTADNERVRRLWSVLDGRDGTVGRWTPVHDLAVVYLAIAHRSDGELSTAEIDAVTRKLGEWLPSALPADVLNVVDESIRRYAGGPSSEVLEDSVERVVESVPVHQRDAVLRDLQYVAEADRVVLVEEKTLIFQLASRWGINLSNLTGGDDA